MKYCTESRILPSLFRSFCTVIKKEVYDSGACTVYSSNAGTDRLHQKEKLFSILLIRGKTMRLAGWSLQKKMELLTNTCIFFFSITIRQCKQFE
jgi:hypothetical protein